METQLVVFSKLDMTVNGGIGAIAHRGGMAVSVMAGGRNHAIWTLHPADRAHIAALLEKALASQQEGAA